MSDQISFPVVKSVAAIGAGTATSIVSQVNSQVGSFLPVDLAGWLAAAASALAVLFSLHLIGEWYWKRVIRPIGVARGWIQKPKGTTFEVDGDGNVTRVEA